MTFDKILHTLRPRQNGRHFTDDIFKGIFLNENVWISIKISLKFVPKGPINNIPALVKIIAWRRSGDKPLSEPMMVRLPTHICVTRPQWWQRSVHKSGSYIICILTPYTVMCLNWKINDHVSTENMYIQSMSLCAQTDILSVLYQENNPKIIIWTNVWQCLVVGYIRNVWIQINRE